MQLSEVWTDMSPWMQTATAVLILLSFIAVVHFIGRHIVAGMVKAAIRKSPMAWDDILFSHHATDRMSLLLPLVIAMLGMPMVPGIPPRADDIIARILSSLVILVVAMIVGALLNGIQDLYNRSPEARNRPIKSYIQLGHIFVYLIAAILIIARMIDKTPLYLMSGLGAMMAIILLIFRDTILSLVASVQLTNNDLIRVGDWIEMPQFGADGDVIDMALNTVRIQNWDKTISVIPTHKFLDNSFRNWRGMFDGGGRRIKRSIFINMATVRFLDDDELDRFEQFNLLRDYIRGKRRELEESRSARDGGDTEVSVNARRLTNLGTLRAYIVAYLRQHQSIHHDMTLLVRQLSPSPEGIPIEIYVFVNDTRWNEYEAIQADIFDHILAMVPEFGLRVYQRPAGQDLTPDEHLVVAGEE